MGQTLGPGAAEPLPPLEDALTLEGALQAYTIAGARQLGLEAMTGSIKVGKRVDLCVFDRDLTSSSSDQIDAGRCLMTLMDGVVRHNANPQST